MKEFLALVGVFLALFFLAFLFHGYWLLCIGFLYLELFWPKKEPEPPYFIPSAYTPYLDAASKAPPLWENEPPVA